MLIACILSADDGKTKMIPGRARVWSILISRCKTDKHTFRGQEGNVHHTSSYKGINNVQWYDLNWDKQNITVHVKIMLKLNNMRTTRVTRHCHACTFPPESLWTMWLKWHLSVKNLQVLSVRLHIHLAALHHYPSQSAACWIITEECPRY